jgi:hypothetical protein
VSSAIVRAKLRNAIRLAVVQVLVIVFGTLGNAATTQWAVIVGVPSSRVSIWLGDYGACFLPFPLLWILAYGKVLNDEESEESTKRIFFWIGIALATSLFLLLLLGALTPFLTMKEINYDQIDQL